MKNEIATKEEGALSFPQGAWGTESVSASDILISKVLLMQSLSAFVVDEKASPGDLVDSLSGTVLAAKASKGLEVIPISLFKNFVIEKFTGSKWEYFSTDPYSPGDEALPWDYEEAGSKFRRNLTLNFYVLRADQANEPDAMPNVVSFRRTSLKEGKKISTWFARAQMMKVPPASRTMVLGSKAEKGDQGPYHIMTVSEGNKTPALAIAKAYSWFQQIQRGVTKVDEAADAPEAPTQSPSGGPSY